LDLGKGNDALDRAGFDKIDNCPNLNVLQRSDAPLSERTDLQIENERRLFIYKLGVCWVDIGSRDR
jgi:hypothetical protein